MVGVSTMSGCPVRCKFCATSKMKKYRNLTAQEIVDQVKFILNLNPDFNPNDSQEFKINYTRMGEPFLNIEAVKEAIIEIEKFVLIRTIIFLQLVLKVRIFLGLKIISPFNFLFIHYTMIAVIG
jgi:pyruvate-formate lyase-activating enzyme